MPSGYHFALEMRRWRDSASDRAKAAQKSKATPPMICGLFIYVAAQCIECTLGLTEVGLLLIFLGFLVTFIGMAVTILSDNRRGSKGKVGGGGLIMIGPIPILFGTDRKWVALMAIVAIAAITIYVMMTAGVKL